MTQLSISSQFDSGAIEVLRLDVAHDIQLRIRQDTAAEFAQWFHFCLHGAAGEPVTLRFMNAKQCAYPKGWEGYQVVCSEDRQHWSRIETSYRRRGYDRAHHSADQRHLLRLLRTLFVRAAPGPVGFGSSLVAGHRGTAGRPPSRARHERAARCQTCTVWWLRKTRRDVWVIARQHPGETMAEWFVEGFLERLLDADDSVSRTLAPALQLPCGAQHEPGRRSAGQPAHQRRGRQPEPGVGRAQHGALA